MKKRFILLGLIILLVTFSSVGFANEKDVLSLKAGSGYGSLGFEYEHIFQNKVAIFAGTSINEFGRFLTIGTRFHPYTTVNHLYFGGSLTIKEMDLSLFLVNSTVGYEWKLGNRLFARAEGGVTLDPKFNVNANYGASISYEF
ncbi:MAG: hypothetical protein KAX49_15630 [Halanaerobiales bacterium]|nr:hypothetical protein [Halanaerobiales bacterium]